MRRLTVLSLLILLTGCNQTDPYLREGVWRPQGVNDVNLRAMVAVPSDLATAAPAGPADGALAAAAANRLRRDQLRKLPDSGVAQIVPVAGGSPASASAAGPSGSGN